ncbi:TPR domain protein [Hortaea werneckii]|nr:TPR domain protein [Hortaea werneckii]
MFSAADDSEAYYNLGSHHWPVTTSSAVAQRWVDRGLIWAYSFNHDEALRCFERAAEADPSCAMAFWGIAFAAGPNYNKAWQYFDKDDLRASVKGANDALARATELAGKTTGVEQGLVRALSARFPPVDDITKQFDTLNRMYADAMRPVYEAYPDDADVAALFAEALMCITPRGLWDLDNGKPSGPHTVEARNTIERGFGLPGGLYHPALCHLHIHVLEMSPFPELALPAADRLRGLVPDASHMLHMPTHIDAAVGDYRRGVDSNSAAITADDKYFARDDAPVSYTAYRVHYICAKIYSAMMSGRRADAMSAADRLEEIIDNKLLREASIPMADWVESFLGSKAHVMIRFGLWNEILRLELPTDRTLYCATTAIILYARGIALSALGRTAEAEAEQAAFEAARANVPASRLNSIPCREVDVLNVASAMLDGELQYRKGNHELAFNKLRHAVELEDGLAYSDPPPWMQPVRHALGGLLLEQGHIEEAERLFREDLGLAKDFPRRRAKLNNVWGLHGLHECFTLAGNEDEAIFLKAALDIALASADVSVSASCYCRLSARTGENSCCG